MRMPLQRLEVLMSLTLRQVVRQRCDQPRRTEQQHPPLQLCVIGE